MLIKRRILEKHANPKVVYRMTVIFRTLQKFKVYNFLFLHSCRFNWYVSQRIANIPYFRKFDAKLKNCKYESRLTEFTN